MAIAYLLPPFLGNLSDLQLILNADFVLIDDLEIFSRKSRVHRGKIRTPTGTQWVGLPVINEDRKKALSDVHIDSKSFKVQDIMRPLSLNYSNSIYFELYRPEIEDDLIYATRFERLIDFAGFIFKRLLVYMEIDIQFVYKSGLSDDEFMGFLKHQAIFQEANSKNYFRPAPETAAIQKKLPEYRQHFGGFEQDCCLLDLLFELGPESWKITDQLLSNNERQ